MPFEKKLEACKKEVEISAAGEGIRFEKDEKGDWYWVSEGAEKVLTEGLERALAVSRP